MVKIVEGGVIVDRLAVSVDVMVVLGLEHNILVVDVHSVVGVVVDRERGRGRGRGLRRHGSDDGSGEEGDLGAIHGQRREFTRGTASLQAS